jgi:hypothetical protein
MIKSVGLDILVSEDIASERMRISRTVPVIVSFRLEREAIPNLYVRVQSDSTVES